MRPATGKTAQPARIRLASRARAKVRAPLGPNSAADRPRRHAMRRVPGRITNRATTATHAPSTPARLGFACTRQARLGRAAAMAMPATAQRRATGRGCARLARQSSARHPTSAIPPGSAIPQLACARIQPRPMALLATTATPGLSCNHDRARPGEGASCMRFRKRRQKVARKRPRTDGISRGSVGFCFRIAATPMGWRPFSLFSASALAWISPTMRRHSAWRSSAVRCCRQGKGVNSTSNVVANCTGKAVSPRWRARCSALRSNQVPRSSSPAPTLDATRGSARQSPPTVGEPGA